MMTSRWFTSGGKTKEKVVWLKDQIAALRETNDRLRDKAKSIHDTIVVNDRQIAEMVLKLNEWEGDRNGRLEE